MSVTVTKTEQTVEVTQDNQTVTLTPVTQTVEVAAAGPQGATGATGAKGDKGDTGAAGSSGVVAVNTPLTNAGTSSAANLSVSAASTSAAGVVQLSDSVSTTSSVLAATPTAVKSAYDIATAGWEAFTFGTAGVVATHPRFLLTTTTGGTSGQIQHTRLVPHRNFTTSNIAFTSGGTALSVPTLIRFGIYTRSGTTFTLVARTASDTTIFAATNTKYTRALDTTGGYPATYAMTAGAEYWISVIQVATTAATILAALARTASGANAATGGQFYTQSTQSDLVASSTGSLSTSSSGNYAEVS
jgi:hypothetical protein